MRKIINWVRQKPLFSAIGTIAIFTLIFVVIWFRGKGVEFIRTDALDTFEHTLDRAIEVNAGDLSTWYRANIVMQCVIIVTGLTATIAAAATTPANAASLKVYTVILTAVTSALAVVLTTFHIRENIETFIRANTDLISIESEYMVARIPLEQILIDKRKAKPSGTDTIVDDRDLPQASKQKATSIIALTMVNSPNTSLLIETKLSVIIPTINSNLSFNKFFIARLT